MHARVLDNNSMEQFKIELRDYKVVAPTLVL